MSADTSGVFARIGTLADRLRERVGRKFGHCRSCGKPTRSHALGSGVLCHVCYTAGERPIATDGGHDVPPGRQCTMCDREAVNPTRSGALCKAHLDALDDDETADNRPPEAGSPRSNPGGNVDASGSSPTYAELYLAARERADADTAYVAHEYIEAVFSAYGWGDLVDQLRYLDEWLVWTPDSRETPLYAHTPDLAGDTTAERDRLAALLEEADLGTERFIDAHDGLKGSFDTGNARPPDDPEIHGNYGVKGGRGGDDTAPWLVDLDIDDYDAAKNATDAVADLRDRTLAVASAHTTVDEPGHLYVAVDGDPRAVVRDVLGRAVDNPQASFGEIRVDQQYVVGPGSEVLCGCDLCTGADAVAGEEYGRYELANDRPPVVWTEEEFREFLLSDPKIEAEAARADARPDHADTGTGTGAGGSLSGDLDDDVSARLKFAKKADEYVAGALRDARAPDDRSAADAALARSVAPWLAYDERAITQVLDRHGTSKWATRTDDSYRGSVLSYAADRGVSSYNPLPYWALVEYAVAEGIVAGEDLVERAGDTGDVVDDPEEYDGDTYRALPNAGVFNQTLGAVEALGVDHGRERAGTEYDPDAAPAAPFALGALDVLTGDERERFLRKRDLNIPTTDEARDRLRDAAFRELRAGNTTVLDAPTALGKTHIGATEPWRRRSDVTGGAPVVHTHPTRDARDEAAGKTSSSSADGASLKGRKEKSPLARGDHDPAEDPDAEDAPNMVITIDGKPASDWFDRQCDDKGLPFSTALALARERNDQGLDDLPPQGQEDPAVAQWNGLPRTDDGEPAKDVIHATHQFLYVPSLRRGTNVILDERPDFTVDLAQDRIRRAVNAFLRVIDAPVSTFEEFVALAKHDAARGDAARERDALDSALNADPPTEWYVDEPDAHALAPDLARAIWNALRWEDPDANGRRSTKVLHEPPRFNAGDGDGYAGVWLSVVIDDDHTVRTVRATPDLSQARAVIGLDAHPSMPMWEQNAGPGMVRDAVLDPTERRLWRRYERGLTTVQVGDATRPRSGPKAREWLNDERVRTVLKALREYYGDGFDTAITTTQIEPVVCSLLADVTDADLDDEHTMHYGEEKSRNPEAFADALAGYVYGCMDPGDDMILDALAELGLDAEPATATTDDGEEYREKGRTFDGPDADAAQALLASVRENHVAQAAGRYARDPGDPESGAVVFVHTDAVPAGFADLQVPGVEWLATDLQREILKELTERPSATTREIADAVDCSKDHVRETFATLEEEGLVRRHPGAGDHGADVYRDDGADDALLNLGLGQIANDPLEDSSRWSLVVWDLHRSATTLGGRRDATNGGEATVATADGADRPPDSGD